MWQTVNELLYCTLFRDLHKFIHDTPQDSLAAIALLHHILTFSHVHVAQGKHSVSLQFLPCDAMRCTVSVIVILSVCLSVTLVDCVHMVRPTIMISSPQGSPIILVSGDIKFIPKFEGGHPERGR